MTHIFGKFIPNEGKASFQVTVISTGCIMTLQQLRGNNLGESKHEMTTLYDDQPIPANFYLLNI